MSDSDGALALSGSGRVLFTARSDGNMSSVAGDGAEHGDVVRERLREGLGLDRLARGYQVHGSVVEHVGHAAPRPEADSTPAEADGQATAVAGVGTMVLAADCLPVALGCQGAVAMIHAGWRGLAAGVLEEGVRALEELGGGKEIIGIVGPGAGVCCYEAGPEVHAAFNGAHRQGSHIDLRAIAHERLLGSGVVQVRDVEVCTICDERYFSHRREGARAGRQAGVAWLS